MKDRLLTIALSVAATYGILKVEPDRPRELEVDRLVVRRELIVSDTGSAWEAGYETHQIPRGLYARSLADGPGGLWVRSRLIKAEVDDPFDDRFHAIERDGTLRRAGPHLLERVARRRLAANGDHPGRRARTVGGAARAVERQHAPGSLAYSNVPPAPRRAADRCAHRPRHDVAGRRRIRRRWAPLPLGNVATVGRRDRAIRHASVGGAEGHER